LSSNLFSGGVGLGSLLGSHFGGALVDVVGHAFGQLVQRVFFGVFEFGQRHVSLLSSILTRGVFPLTCDSRNAEIPIQKFAKGPVITEAAWLLRAHPRAVQQLLRSTGNGFVELLPLAGSDARAIADVMKKYRDIRAQLADAALVYLADLHEIDTLFTLDQRDFSVYRFRRSRRFKVVPGR
jgi:predicted nucleic acid-binding protein